MTVLSSATVRALLGREQAVVGIEDLAAVRIGRSMLIGWVGLVIVVVAEQAASYFARVSGNNNRWRG